MYYWVVAYGRPGSKLDMKRMLMGPYASRMQAQGVADGLSTESDILDLPTRNTATATRMLKAKGISLESEKKGQWEEQMSRVRHPVRKEEDL